MDSIFLVGFMGCGKTTVGRLLAERLGLVFADVDSLIVEAEGRSIAEIFAAEGEAAFRAVERRILSGLVVVGTSVVSTGGGLFSDPENRRLIADAGGWSVFLDAPWAVLEKRLGVRDSSRPMWESPLDARRLYDRRMSDYHYADTRVVVGEGDSPADTVTAILKVRSELACAI